MHIRVWVPPRWFWALLIGGPLVLMVLAALAAVALVHVALGAGNTVPDRQAALCTTLGLPIGCHPVASTRVAATLELGVSDASYEVDAPAPPTPQPAVLLVVRIRNRTFSVPYIAWEDAPRPACPWLGCYAKHEADPEYSGPTEADLLDPVIIRDKLLWQELEPAIAAKVRLITGATGRPVITRVTALSIDDETTTGLATTIRARVVVSFF